MKFPEFVLKLAQAQIRREDSRTQAVKVTAPPESTLNRFTLPASMTTPQNPQLGTFTIPGNPIGKPRMTRRDKWAKRPAVMRYREWADRARVCAAGNLPDDPLEVSWLAIFEMPQSWSKKKRAAHAGAPHRAKPDRDNIDKALLDSLFEQDQGIASGTLRKIWDDGSGPRLEVTAIGSAKAKT